MRLLFSSVARDDLRSITRYIATARPNVAREIFIRIRDKCHLIAKHPELGQRRFELGEGYRSFVTERWVILDEVFENTVEIHRILDAARDVDPLVDR